MALRHPLGGRLVADTISQGKPVGLPRSGAHADLQDSEWPEHHTFGEVVSRFKGQGQAQDTFQFL